MMRIWKWPLQVTDRNALLMPEGAKLLDVQMQGETCCLWALVDESATEETRDIAIYGTGNPIPRIPGQYIATFQMYGGELIFHAFDVTGRS